MSEPGQKPGCLAPECVPDNSTSQMLFPEADKRPNIISIIMTQLILKKLSLQAGVLLNSRTEDKPCYPDTGRAGTTQGTVALGVVQPRAGPVSGPFLKSCTLILARTLSHHRAIAFFVFIPEVLTKKFSEEREP